MTHVTEKSFSTAGEDVADQRTVNLGSAAAFAKLPARIDLEGAPFFLTRDETGYKLLSTVCPHQGGQVMDRGACFECPHHGWRFRHDGQCINVPSRQLASYRVTEVGGQLLAEAPVLRPTPRLGRRHRRLDGLTIQLHAHACLEIKYCGFTLLTDPWLAGTAFLGSWLHYPPPVVRVEELKPDAILITHEHSDHFSEATLDFFDRSTTIYVPDFPNRRLCERLAALGFVEVRSLGFGETYSLAEAFRLTYYEPESLWNDCLALLEIDGFRLLNINDAGLNRRIAKRVGRVDMVAAQFSTGASGYPLTWTHLSREKKTEITERARLGKIQMLKEAMDMYGARTLLPFASHFTLWHPSHREFLTQLRVNTLDDIVDAFNSSSINVVDLLAGDVWHGDTGAIERTKRDRAVLYDKATILQHVAEQFDAVEFRKYQPAGDLIDWLEVSEYFALFNETTEIAFCEDMTVRVSALDEESGTELFAVSFIVERGRLKVVDGTFTPNLLIEIPVNILTQVIRENLSWDEAFIGYWCRFTRTPDVYHAGFWRMLQAPYFQKSGAPQVAIAAAFQPITRLSILADVVEEYGEMAERILGRYGLYCTGCQNSTAESLAAGSKAHGISDVQIDRMIRELNHSVVFAPSITTR